MIKRIYISGPIAHYDLEERQKAFREISDKLKLAGYEPVNPFDNGVPQEAGWRVHMRVDIENLLKCDAIVMMPNWELSKGCKLELDVASSCGIHVILHGLKVKYDN